MRSSGVSDKGSSGVSDIEELTLPRLQAEADGRGADVLPRFSGSFSLAQAHVVVGMRD